jgi:hypothetical protein
MTNTQDTQIPMLIPGANAGSRANFGPAIIEADARRDKPIPLVTQGSKRQASRGMTFALYRVDHAAGSSHRWMAIIMFAWFPSCGATTILELTNQAF